MPKPPSGGFFRPWGILCLAYALSSQSGCQKPGCLHMIPFSCILILPCAMDRLHGSCPFPQRDTADACRIPSGTDRHGELPFQQPSIQQGRPTFPAPFPTTLTRPKKKATCRACRLSYPYKSLACESLSADPDIYEPGRSHATDGQRLPPRTSVWLPSPD